MAEAQPESRVNLMPTLRRSVVLDRSAAKLAIKPQPENPMCCTYEALDEKVITLPKMVVTARRGAGPSTEQIYLQLTQHPPKLTWNPGSGTFDYDSGGAEVEVVTTPVIEAPHPSPPPAADLTTFQVGEPYVINGQILVQLTWTFGNGTVYTVQAVSWNGEWFAYIQGVGWRVHSNSGNYDAPWVSSGPPPETSRIANPPPTGGRGGGGYLN